MSSEKKPMGYTVDQIEHLFAHHPLDPELQGKFDGLKRGFKDLAILVKTVVPDCPDQTAAIRKIIEAKDAACRGLVSATIPMKESDDA